MRISGSISPKLNEIFIHEETVYKAVHGYTCEDCYFTKSYGDCKAINCLTHDVVLKKLRKAVETDYRLSKDIFIGSEE
jgi:hypothetical protein